MSAWVKVGNGYTLEGAELRKVDGRWVLAWLGHTATLPRRASLDHAEGLLAQWRSSAA